EVGDERRDVVVCERRLHARHERAGLERGRVGDPAGQVRRVIGEEPARDRRPGADVREVRADDARRNALDRMTAETGPARGSVAQRPNPESESTTTRSRMLAWEAPQNSAH